MQLQSQLKLLQRFVENIQKLDPLTAFVGGGREEKITSLLSEAMACANLLPHSALQTAMSVLLSATASTSSSSRSRAKWGGIRSPLSPLLLSPHLCRDITCLRIIQRLFFPDISSRSSTSDGNKICLLSPKRFYGFSNSSQQLYLDAGYYRSSLSPSLCPSSPPLLLSSWLLNLCCLHCCFYYDYCLSC
jgi:hypothetical protein